MSGPPPKRSAERRRRNKDVVETQQVNLDELISLPVEIPKPPQYVDQDTGEIIDLWEPLTLSFWESFSRSGQAIFYEPSDWLSAYTLMEILDRWLKPQDVKVGQTGSAGQEQGGGDIEYIFEQKIVAMPAGVISSIYKALGDLMATEGARRKLRIELERKKATDAALGGEGADVVSIVRSREEAFARAKQAREA